MRAGATTAVAVCGVLGLAGGARAVGAKCKPDGDTDAV